MKDSTNQKSQQGLYSLSCAAITLVIITLCFIVTSACMAQDTISVANDNINEATMVSDRLDSIQKFNVPKVSDSLDHSYWSTESIHIKGIYLVSLPDTVDLLLIDSLHVYSFPCRGKVCSRFKYRGRHAHKGVDIPLCIGDDINAAFDGVVRIVKPTRHSGGYGNLVVIRHFNGLETYYGHLKKSLVRCGDTVRAGELIGYAGNTGRSTGPHLHFETRYKGKAFDPERIFDFQNRTLRSETLSLKKHYFSCHSHYGMTDQQSLAVFKNPPRTTSAPKYYKVRRGDSLARIAKRQGTNVVNLCKLNGIKENKYIYVGQKLRIK